MILKTYQQALENLHKIREATSFEIRSLMLNSKIEALPYGVFLPDDFIAELEEFTSRNALVNFQMGTGEGKVELNHCCPRCLKAHALKKGKDIGMDRISLSFISELFDCETGHNGYYLDNDGLVKL